MFGQQALSTHEKQIKQGIDRIDNTVNPFLQRQNIFLQDTFSQQQNVTEIIESEQCFDVNSIAVDGVTLFSQQTLSKLTQPFLEQCLGLNEINQLIAHISNFYLESGFVTSRAYINPQDLSDGTLKLFVLEGFVEDLVVSDFSITDNQLKNAFPLNSGEVLNLRDVEQGLENLNRLGQNQATVELAPGNELGSSIVNIQNQYNRPWRGSVGLNNTGVEDTGELQLDGNFIYDNLLGINDSWIASVSSNVGEHDLPVAESRSYSLLATVPYNYWYFTVSNSFFEYEQSVIGETIEFLTSGSSLNSSIGADYTYSRSQTDKLNFALLFNRKESRNFIEDVFLETSSRTIYVWDLSASYLKHFKAGTLTANLGINKSVPWFDSTRELASAEDDFQFTKYFANLNFSSQFNIANRTVLYSADMQLLYSPKIILASEGITVGGRYSVRGLSQNSLFGHRGGFVRNDFTIPFNTGVPALGQIHMLVGFDIGATNLPEFPNRNVDWVAGSQVGFRLLTAKYNFTFSYARALRVPSFIDVRRNDLDFSVRVNF